MDEIYDGSGQQEQVCCLGLCYVLLSTCSSLTDFYYLVRILGLSRPTLLLIPSQSIALNLMPALGPVLLVQNLLGRLALPYLSLRHK